MKPDEVQAAAAVLALSGGTVAFIVGLLQYRKSQTWKIKEFVAGEMKQFFDDYHVRNALLMIDWGSRGICFDPPDGSKRDVTRVTRTMQVGALMPHTLASKERSADQVDLDVAYGFSEVETQIRDTYDRLLDAFERFSGFLESGIVEVGDLRPYLRYWMDDVASTKASADDLRWTVALLAYIEFYRFTGTQHLFREFGYDISVGGPIWSELKRSPELAPFAERLERAVLGDGAARQEATCA
jgi:hypothetical protein